MSDYVQVNDYSAKDALANGDPEKVILGSDIDDELSGISVAIATKYDSADLASQAQAEAESSNAVLMTPGRVANWADYNAGMIGDIQALADPNDDRILGWDDSAGAAIAYDLSTGLTTSGTNLLIDTAVVPQLSAQNTFTGVEQSITAAEAKIVLTSGAVVGRAWASTADSYVYFGATSNHPTGILVNGGVVASFTASNTTTTFNGVAVSDFGRISQSNTWTGAANYFETIRVYDAGNTDFMEFAHNGTDLLVTFSGTTELDITVTTFDFNGNLDLSGTVTSPNSSASEVGYKGTPQNAQSANYTLVLTDAGKTIYYTSSSGDTLTIPANASVAFPVGTIVRVVNNGGGTMTIAITTDTLSLAGVGTTGSRSLGDHGVATLEKVASTEWFISGVGVS